MHILIMQLIIYLCINDLKISIVIQYIKSLFKNGIDIFDILTIT